MYVLISRRRLIVMSSRAVLSMCMGVYDGKQLLLQLQLGPLAIPLPMERLRLG